MPLSQSARRFHRQTARTCFNGTWRYLDKPERGPADDRRMLELVHASSFHWKLVGGVRRWAVSDWQISRVYATLNQPMLAAQFARACLEKCREHRLSEVLPTAYEALARASAVAQDFKSARRYLSRARRLLDAAALNDADRAIYEGQIRSTQEMIP